MLTPEMRGRAAVALLVCGILLVLAGNGIGGYFTPDDMMNLYRAWSASPSELLRQDRPLVQLVYRGLFALAGLSPLPYRLLAFALLLVNLALLYRFCLHLTGAREIAALACLLAAYHAHLADLYYSSGTFYDLFCYLFLFWVLNSYIAIRRTGQYPGGRQTALLMVLYVAALESKEMAVAVPLYLLLYEALYQKDLRRWLRHGAWFWWLTLPVSAVYAAAKVTGPNAMTGNPAYAPQFSVHAFFSGWIQYLNDLFYGAIAFNTVKVVLLFALLLWLALRLRRREMLFGWVMGFAGALPVIFLPRRGFFAVYVTLPGWYLYFASALAAARDGIVRRFPRWAAAFGARPEQAALFVIIALLLVPLHWRERREGNWWVPYSYAQVRSVLGPLDHSGPLPKGARILFLKDPFDPADWILSNMFRLHYRDDSLHVDRIKDHPELAGQAAKYDRVYVLDARGLQRVR